MSLFYEGWGATIVKELIETSPPSSINWWPQTMAWQVIAIIGLFWLLRKVYQRWRLYQHNVYRRDAITWLERLPDYQSLTEQPIYRQLPNLLRKTALGGYQRNEIALLSGQDWTEWLDKQCELSQFGANGAITLHRLAYDASLTMTAEDISTLTQQIKLWIHHHRGAYV
ncbi:DUF4381 domain-containing protein [Shewanella sp. TC10]|uniref:DUF4381 domain-containing protein n=1 Tax=Shewanella sp. TC10 TaxID=1419739 RepID=UPI00129E6481|nr:DUF4381 domain-containing protein [Shewanella sp. TC10]